MARVKSEIYEKLITAESLADDYARLDREHYAFASWVAEVDGEIVGVALYQQHPGQYHPRKYYLELGVLPAYRRRGIGGALYRKLREELEPRDPIALRGGTREHWADSVAFLQRRGFEEEMRSWESRLDLSTFHPDALAAHLAAAEAAGYAFQSFVDLAADPERDQKLYEIVKVARRDIPSAEPLTDLTYEQWKKGIDRPQFFPEAYMVAIKDGQMVGVSTMWTTDEADVAETGVTAVLREHRGAGVAKALKVKALGVVKAMGGYRKVKTWNATTNGPMLAINEWLGFVRQPAWISCRLQLKAEE